MTKSRSKADTETRCPIYLFTGMTPEARIFQPLIERLPQCEPVDWLEPLAGESIMHYADRIADSIPTPDCFVGGVSFGGIMAWEVSRSLRPKGCILISSISSPQMLPPWLRVFRGVSGKHCESILRAAGFCATGIPRGLKTRSTARLAKLGGDAGKWHRWATSAVLSWNSESLPSTTQRLHIHGDHDTTFPVKYVDRPDVIIEGGGHSLAMTHPDQVAEAIRQFAGG